jgi:hypothetical protein
LIFIFHIVLELSIVHFDDLFEHLSWVYSHLLSDLKDLWVELLQVDVIKVYLLIVIDLPIVMMLMVVVVLVIILVHLGELLLQSRETVTGS